MVQLFKENDLRRRELRVYGDGSDRLDFTYVDDLIAGIVAVIEHEAARNEILNLTYGCSRSIQDLIGLLAGRFPDLKVAYSPRGKLTPQRGTLCIDKARALIDYDPDFPLERGLPR